MDNRVLEFSAVIRMTCSYRSTIGRDSSGLVTVAFDNSPKAVEISSLKEFDETASRLNLGIILSFSSKATPHDLVDGIEKSFDSPGTMPRLIIVEGLGVFAVGYSKPDADSLVGSLLEQRPYTDPPEPLRRTGRLEHRVVVVTGSAQGFGKGIAQELAREGAYVVVADLNGEAGGAFAAELDTSHGAGTAIFQKADVANLESVEQLVEAAVRSYGGIDMFIANAGVLKAGPIDQMDERSFDLVTNVNYKGFYICTKAVTPLLKLQHKYALSHFMDIIQINSKSGLEGSNKNFAYAGSKFGALGLVQSFALELAGHNIKVNAICPGNYYEGPLWADPKNGLFVQYLQAGKVPGAKTIEDVKQFYMAKVPMKRGCTPLDVTRAAMYIREQEYETGQAIPVTGGQVMLH